MGSRVVARTQDLGFRSEGYMHTRGGGEAEDGGCFPPSLLRQHGRRVSESVLARVGGVEGPSELVRSLNDALKPKLHYAYDTYAGAYLRTPA
jgi:hypothetical protein